MSPRPLVTHFARCSSLALALALATPAAAAPPASSSAAKEPAQPSTGQAPASASAPAAPSSPDGAPSKAAEIRKLSSTLADVAEKVSPSVVQIDVTAGGVVRPTRRLFQGGEEDRHGLGSGVIFSADGAILTNNHVIEEARTIVVRLRDGRTFPGRVVGRDPATDLAVLRVEARDLPAATFADSESARVGEWVLAIGSPFGLGHTVTSGVLSAKARGGVGINAVEDYLQTDASINPGNSGGPLVNLDGKVLGINTMVVSRGQGIGLAVPAVMARRVADQILKIGRVERAYIGLGMQDLTPQIATEIASAPPAGALVNTVAPTGPGGKASIAPGDVITSFGGKPVRAAQDVIREVFLHTSGDVVTLELVRGGKKVQARVTLAPRNDPPPPELPVERPATPQPGLGLSTRDVSDEGQKGARVAAVAPDSVADRAGIKINDMILEADGVKSPSSKDVDTAAKDGHMLLRVRRLGASFYVALRR